MPSWQHIGSYAESRRYFAAKAFNLLLVIAMLSVFGSWATKAAARDEATAQQIALAERAAQRGPYANDGAFEGSAQGFGGPVRTRVVVENGYISSVDIVEASHEDETWLDMCLGLPDRIVKAQSTRVDVISGATYTSSGILNAATEALRQAAGGSR